MNRRTGIVVLVSVALLSAAGLATAYLFTHKPEPEGPSIIDQSAERLHEQKVACLEGGGTWQPVINNCQQPIGQPVAPAPAPAGTGGNAITIEEHLAAQEVKYDVKQTTGYRLQASLREIVIHGRAACDVLGPTPTDAEATGVAAAAAQTLGFPQQIGIEVVAALYVNFC